jgi:hypothetical protein
MKNTHVQAFELIEGSFESSTWFVLFSLCIVEVLRNVFFLVMHFLCMCCACDFMFQTEV